MKAVETQTGACVVRYVVGGFGHDLEDNAERLMVRGEVFVEIGGKSTEGGLTLETDLLGEAVRLVTVMELRLHFGH